MLDKMFEQFKDFAELRMFAEAQQKTILTQSKKISELEAEVSRLIAELAKPKMALVPPVEGTLTIPINSDEYIAKTELEKLKLSSQIRELTMEEARKLEIYSKIIAQHAAKHKPQVIDTKKIPTDQLLNAANDTDELFSKKTD